MPNPIITPKDQSGMVPERMLKRKPLLSLRDFDRMREEALKGENEHERIFNAAAAVMEYFEGMVERGHLKINFMTPERVMSNHGPRVPCLRCTLCGGAWTEDQKLCDGGCPYCGAKIVPA